jgi:hypothetical protein
MPLAMGPATGARGRRSPERLSIGLPTAKALRRLLYFVRMALP